MAKKNEAPKNTALWPVELYGQLTGRDYPPVSFYFTVNFDGITSTNDSSFQEVSGISTKIATDKEWAEGGQNGFRYKFPSPPKYENLVLKRGLLVDSELITWCEDAIENFTFSPKLVTVRLLNAYGLPLSTWSFANAYPVGWSISDFKSQENALAIETLELAYTSFTRVKA